MYIAMNRFRVARGSEDDFIEMWRGRDSRLKEMDGFLGFHLLRGAEAEDHTLFASHTTWRNEASFAEWTRSEQFRTAHANAGRSKVAYLGPPQFEGFDAVLGQ